MRDPPNGADPDPDPAPIPDPVQSVLMAVSFAARDHLALPPHGPVRVFEVLNALASVAATVAAGTGEVTTCLRYIVNTYDQQIRECRALYGVPLLEDDK